MRIREIKAEHSTFVYKEKLLIQLLLLFILLFFSCSVRTSQLQAVQYIYSYPVNYYKEGGITKVYSLNDTIAIFYSNDYVLYRLAPTVDFETGQNIEGSEKWFIYKQGSPYGHLLSSIQDTTSGTDLRVDSFVAKNVPKGKDFELPPDSLYRLVKSDKHEKKGQLCERYALVKKQNEMLFDSIYYFYSSKLKNINFSFSKVLDKQKGMKLQKAVFIYNEGFSPTPNTVLPKRKFLFEIKEHLPVNMQEVTRLIERIRTFKYK